MSNKERSDKELVQQFVIGHRKGALTTDKLFDAKRALGISKGMESLALIATQVEELTPEDKALIQINANLSVAGTDMNAPDVLAADNTFAFESTTEEAGESITDVTTGFGELWGGIIGTARTMSKINETTRADVELTIDALKFVADKGPAITAEEIEIDNLPEILSIRDNTHMDGEHLRRLADVREEMTQKLAGYTVDCINTVRSIIKSGLSEFGKDTAEVAQESLTEHTRTLAVVMEEFTASDDGVIWNIELPGGYVYEKDEEGDPVFCPSDTPRDLTLAKFKVTPDYLATLLTEAQKNQELLDMSSQAVQMLLDSDLMFSIKQFGTTVQTLLQGLPARSKTKELIIGYCEMFLKAVKVANVELSFMMYASRFILAHNELLLTLADKATPAPMENNNA